MLATAARENSAYAAPGPRNLSTPATSSPPTSKRVSPSGDWLSERKETCTNRVTSRYRSRSIFDTILGPTAGVARDLFSIVNSPFREGEFSQAELEKLRRLTPGMELWYLSGLSRMASQHLGEELGLPQRKPTAQERGGRR